MHLMNDIQEMQGLSARNTDQSRTGRTEALLGFIGIHLHEVLPLGYSVNVDREFFESVYHNSRETLINFNLDPLTRRE